MGKDLEMVKLIVFDLDGVLVDARELHYEALNLALADIDESFVISRPEHLSTYDGLSTTKKLQMLTENKGLPEKFHHSVWKLKQQKTVEIINNFEHDHRMINCNLSEEDFLNILIFFIRIKMLQNQSQVLRYI